MKNIRNILSSVLFALAAIFAVEAYSADFNNDNTTVAEELATAPQIKVLAHGVEINITDSDTHQVSVYAITGQIVKTTEAVNGVTTIDLPAGYYIVRVDNLSKRVIIR